MESWPSQVPVDVKVGTESDILDHDKHHARYAATVQNAAVFPCFLAFPKDG